MTTSSTTAFNPTIVELVENAADMAGTELRTGWDFRAARFSMNLLLAEWANRGLNYWTLSSTSTLCVQGTATYNLPTDCVDVFEMDMRTNVASQTLQADLRMNRISASVYATIPNKLSQGRPIQYMVNRQIAPTVTVWPVPDGTQTWTLFFYYLRRIQDAGSNAGFTLDMPFRFLPAFVAGLAYHIAMRKPELMDRVPGLKINYAEQFQLAADEDREKASVRFVPYVGPGGM